VDGGASLPLNGSGMAMQIEDDDAVESGVMVWHQGREGSEGFNRFCSESYAGREFDPLEIN
jgi:hypothetical protein